LTVQVFFAAGAKLFERYREPLERALTDAGVHFHLFDQTDDPAGVEYIVFSPSGVISDFTPYSRARAVLNLWAGVERIVTNETLTQPLCRMVDPAMTESMTEWVTGHVLRHHLGMDLHIKNQDGVWRHEIVPPVARDRTVAMLGLGALGQSAARAMQALNFNVIGWSRSQKDLTGLSCRSGDEGLEAVLRQAEIVVLLMPLTADTENLLDARRLGWLPKGAVIINPGRGALIDDSALLAALDDDRVGHATLDVFRTEPLPADHPFWAHPRVTVTPHIAAETNPLTASRVIAENIRRGEAGEPLLHLVDRGRGY
jgi:glyoxylate/hydroxypyruvate reductase